MTQAQAGVFDEFYFKHGCGEIPYERGGLWVDFFTKIADRVVSEINPGSALDAGCAIGILVEELRKRGVDAEGIDVSEYAISQVPEELRPYCRVASITEPFGRRYDLITCIEVMEHVPVELCDAALDNLCAHTDDILFSSSSSDHREATHQNVRPVAAWVEDFARRGFYRDVDFDAGFLTEDAFRVRRSRDPLHRVIADYERYVGPTRVAIAQLRTQADEQRRTIESLRVQAEQAARAAEQSQREAAEAAALQVRAVEAERDALREQKDRAEAEVAAIRATATWRAAERLRPIARRFRPRPSR